MTKYSQATTTITRRSLKTTKRIFITNYRGLSDHDKNKQKYLKTQLRLSRKTAHMTGSLEGQIMVSFSRTHALRILI